MLCSLTNKGNYAINANIDFRLTGSNFGYSNPNWGTYYNLYNLLITCITYF